ncbi:twin-arginine translocase subunit TatC [Pseudarthrobacter sp. J75]|uniref:twin-arginine translocase subunit TatC n=1 Tax=unclassified Pseudarthrobacter TaxID=2647000 RepID=UPI002E8071DD|nr:MULTISPECIES: twin-arginine translocase subunit TatC [unclassified Pseudarthrobacter]MEE2523120.1 twin-arginine translocase subunit TatC [Pseudarthrobacter sp. J47]MEE2529803.1 twin-arginine translocase subunit TatC [Pseudarthrobacter sp. J75]
MALWDHLRELKNRLIKSAIGILVAAVGGWFLYDPVVNGLSSPLITIAEETGRTAVLNFATIADPFAFKIQIAIQIGLVISSPIWIYQVWAFITPGLTSKERRYTLGYMFAGVPLFLAGVYVGWWVFPTVVRALLQFTPAEGANNIGAADYLTFVTQMFLILGISFLVPVLLVGINMAGVVRGRTILKAWRIIVFLVFVLTALAAPGTDALSMIMLAGPLLVLFFAAIGLCILNDNRRDKRAAKVAAETEANADVATPRSELKNL